MADPIVGKISVGDGATFTPAISNAGVLSFTNNKNLPNPAPFDIPAKVLEAGESTLRGLVADAETAEQNASDSATAAANSALAAEDAAERAESFTPEGFEARVEALETQVPINTANIAQNTGGISANSKRIGNIEKLLQGNLYDYQTDNTSAYTKTVPSGAMPYAGLEKVGGKTVVWNQLYRVVDGSSTSYGVSIVRSSSANTYTVSGTANTTTTIWLTILKPDGTSYDDPDRLINGHKYATLLKGNNLPLFRHSYDGVNRSNKSYILTGNGSYGFPFGFDVTTGVTYNFTVKIMLIDLTLMFGAGNEPTIEQFEAMFPSDWYNATYGTLLSAGVTEVVSKDSNNATLQTYSIPASIQALEGYGWGIDNVYNEVDIENKKYIKRIGKYDFSGNENLLYYGSQFHETTDTFVVAFYNVALFGKVSNRKCMSNNFVGYVGFNWETPFAVFFNPEVSDSHFVYFILPFSIKSGLSTSSTNAEKLTAAKEWFQAHPTTIYYQLATPVETDISAYLTDDNLIQVEAGGTLTFPNQNGTDYQIPVPSEEEYMINLQEALS